MNASGWRFSVISMIFLILLLVAGILTVRLFNMEITRTTMPQQRPASNTLIHETVDLPEPVIQPSENQLKLLARLTTAAATKKQLGTQVDQTTPVQSNRDTSISHPIPPAVITTLIGKAWILEANGQPKYLRIEDPLNRNYRVETAEHSRLGIRFSDGTEIQLGPEASITLDDYLLNPDQPEQSRFKLRMARGMLRVITGMIVKLNPNRFEVHTRMATIGIRGCHVAVRSDANKDQIYVLGLSENRTVAVITGTRGEIIRNITSGLPAEEPVATRIFLMDQPNQMVTCQLGHEPFQSPFSVEESRSIMSDTARFSPSRYEWSGKPGEATLRIQPDSSPAESSP